MSFQPVVLGSGMVGWSFLTRTRDRQQALFNASPQQQRDIDYFKANIASVETPEDLVNDRRLLQVALGAFDLDDDINNKFFIKKILSGAPGDSDALMNRLADKRYKEFSESFGLGENSIRWTGASTLMDAVAESYSERQFEIAVGEQNSSMRLALNIDRELSDIASDDQSETAKWFTIMGNPPLRSVFETAFGLPSSVGTLDLDQQLSIFSDRAERYMGSSDVSQFADADKLEALTRRFLLQDQMKNSPVAASSASIALTLLRGFG